MKIDRHIARRLANEPKLIRISMAWQSRNAEVVPRGRYAVYEGRIKECVHLAPAIVLEGANRGHRLTVCAEPQCTVHHAESTQAREERERMHATHKREEAETRAKLTARSRSLAAVLERVASPLPVDDLCLVAATLIQRLPPEYLSVLCQRHQLAKKRADINDPRALLTKHLDGLDENAAARLLVEMSLVESTVNAYARNADGALSAIAKRYGID
jgi:hypothetical protein